MNQNSNAFAQHDSHRDPEPKESGQQLIEFSFTFIMFCGLFLALIMFAYVFFAHIVINNAAREGSRHLYTHPLLPDDDTTFATADAEAQYVMTSSLPVLDWRQVNINISPPVSARVAGSYVMVEIEYDVPLPRYEFPIGWGDTRWVLIEPITLQAMSRRSLD